MEEQHRCNVELTSTRSRVNQVARETAASLARQRADIAFPNTTTELATAKRLAICHGLQLPLFPLMHSADASAVVTATPRATTMTKCFVYGGDSPNL